MLPLAFCCGDFAAKIWSSFDAEISLDVELLSFENGFSLPYCLPLDLNERSTFNVTANEKGASVVF